MWITVRVASKEPVTGDIRDERDRDPMPFIGWLGLFQAITDLVAMDDEEQ